jgi:hypothetical protein
VNGSIRTGVAFAFTVAIGYAACSVLFWLFPGIAMAFMNSLFHGLDFGKLQASNTFSFGGFAYAVVMLSAWAFMLGAVFEGIQRRLRAPG